MPLLRCAQSSVSERTRCQRQGTGGGRGVLASCGDALDGMVVGTLGVMFG